SGLARSTASSTKTKPQRSRSATADPKTHLATEIQRGYHWVDRLRKRDFKRGGWEVVIIGLLHQLSKNPRYEKSCEEILTKLAPVDMEPTQEAAKQQYACL